MNAADTALIVKRALEGQYGLWVDTDYGHLDLWGNELAHTWDNLAPGEGFTVLGIITKETAR